MTLVNHTKNVNKENWRLKEKKIRARNLPLASDPYDTIEKSHIEGFYCPIFT